MRHSVALNTKKCRGCTTCIKSCPTEAIRVRSGKATILPNRCIDCGTCVQVCPHQAVQSIRSEFYMLQRFQYNIAVPDPALYGQFHNLDDINIILNGLLAIGFDDVFESAAAAELLAEQVDADVLMILTEVEKVAVNWGKPDQKDLDRMSLEEASRYMEEGHFAAGSMLPKVQAAMKFVRSNPSKRAVITSLDKAIDALAGKTGTVVSFA